MANDPVANSPHLKRDVDRAIAILEDEGFEHDYYYGSPIKYTGSLMRKTNEDGVDTLVYLFRGCVNGTMSIVKGEQSHLMMAHEFNRAMRPTKLERLLDSIWGAKPKPV